MAIDLWAARLERPLSEKEMEHMLALLPPQRQGRILSIKQEGKRREPLCAYLILRYALWEQYHWRDFPELELSSFGKPFFPAFPEIHFNISHTTGAVLVGLSDQPIGVDIEKIRPVSQRVMRRLADVGTEREFFQSWVRREARSKRGGNGVGTMLAAETPLQYGEYFYNCETFSGYVAGIATRSEDIPGKLRKFSLDEIL